jgi:hypothetical protein
VVERQLPKLYVVGSIPIARSKPQSFLRRICTMQDISPADWKTFKRVREVALERFCEQVLDDVTRIASDNAKSKHERYLAIYRLMQERDKEINPIFDTLRRSTAIRQLCSFRLNDLLSAQDLSQFTPELVQSVENIVRIYTRPLETVDGDAELD